MRKEIGSEFWEIPISEKNNLFPEDTQWFMSGRSALQAIIAENDFRTVALPFWICESVIEQFINKGIDVVFYDKEIPEADAIVIMDFFGFSQKKIISSFNGIKIRDVTHSIFSNSFSDSDYYFGSLRKWAGFYSGGFAWGFKEPINYETDTSNYLSLRRKAMVLKRDYIEEKIDSKKYLDIFNQAEQELKAVGILPAALSDIQKAKILDVDFIRKSRRHNANVLLEALKDIAIYPILEDHDCPLFVPIRLKNRDKLRERLIESQIYCPVHWPISKLHKLQPWMKLFYEEQLSLVCDQRYSEKDMYKIIKVIRDFLKEEEKINV